MRKRMNDAYTLFSNFKVCNSSGNYVWTRPSQASCIPRSTRMYNACVDDDGGGGGDGDGDNPHMDWDCGCPLKVQKRALHADNSFEF